jgi:hypothetical protein
MESVIELESELLIDRSSLNDPFLRLIADALGTPVLNGSAWVAVAKQDLGRAYTLNTSQQAVAETWRQ